MSDYRLADLLDLGIIQKMADAHYRAAGMPIGIIDAIDGSILVGSGWQDICVKFHRANQLSLQRCRESDSYIKDRLVQGEACHYKCKNGLWDIGVPIVVAGRHLATLFLGQFFYEGEAPDRDFFTRQAHEFGFNGNDYLAALDRVPVFSREKVDYILEYDKALVDFIADLAEQALLKIKADEKIRESEWKFHAVFDQSYQLIGLLSIDGRMLEANRTALAFGGIEEADVIGRPFWETAWLAHSPELQEKMRLAVQKVAKGELVQFETFHPAADGNLRYVDFSLKPVKDDTGRVIMLMPEGRDITERKQAAGEIKRQAEFLQILIDSMPYPVFYKDCQGRYLGCNSAFERFYGISREQIAGKTVHDIAPKELADVYHQADLALFAHPGMQIYEGVIQSTDRAQHDVIFHKATFNSPDGVLSGLIGAVVDITERKQAEKDRLDNLRFFECMDRVNRAMQGANDLDQVMGDVIEEMLSIFDCDRAWLLYPCDPEAASWRVPMERTRPEYPGALEMGVELPMSPDVVNHMQTALAASGPVTFGPGSAQPLVGEVTERFQHKSQIFMAVYPKVDKPWLIGMHQCSYPRVWTQEEKKLLQEISRRMSDTLTSLLMYRDLRMSEAENRAIVNAVPDLLFRVHKDGIITDFRKPESMELYVSPEQFLGKAIIDVLPPDVSQAATAAIEKALNTKEVATFEYDLEIKKQRRYFEGRVVALSSEEALTVVRDITIRKQAEDALLESETKYCSLVEKSLLGVYIIQDNLFKFVNNRYCEMIGYEYEEIVDRMNPIDITHPEDKKIVEENIRKRIAGEIDSLEYIIRTVRKDGRAITTRVHGGRMIFQGRPAIMGTVIDITESEEAKRALQESEAKMRSILDNIGIGVSLISPEMEILELNRRMHQWFPAVDPGQRPICYQAFNDPPREEMCDYCPTCKTLQDGLVHEATTQTPQAGAIRNYRIVSTPILNQSGKVTAAIEMVEDITDKLSLESQLSQAQKMESVGRLAGGVAHDFNNMLGVIIGHTELALDQMDPSQPLFTPMQEILQAALRSAALTRQLLAFARKQAVAPKVLDLNETVEGMLKMLRRLIGEDINLVWLPDSDLWPVKMDPSQIDQILANLCVNARDAITGVGKITIETQTVTFDEAYCAEHPGFIPGDFVLLAFSDDGHGMDKEILGKIFEPFFTTKGVGQGTGLGLATVYGVVKQNNGFINVYSEPGQGSTFKIYLPRHAAKEEETRKESPAAPDAQGDETILLVEDEAAILRIARLMLENLGYRVLSASTPGNAITVAREHAGEIHLLLTDVVMPEMNGRDLAKKLISLYPELRSLFMSGYTGNVIAHHGILGEGINFIQKPFSMQALAVKVREALESK
ncbi:MAG: PAS domain S-box protein [Proteobacteria bacterium]|nr:PAS domain S-box protein [Pseudomonadota bacterium]